MQGFKWLLDSVYMYFVSAPLMIIVPVFTAVSADGTDREYDGEIVTVPAEGLKLIWNRIPAGSYSYCFVLRDLSGVTHYTDSVSITF